MSAFLSNRFYAQKNILTHTVTTYSYTGDFILNSFKGERYRLNIKI